MKFAGKRYIGLLFVVASLIASCSAQSNDSGCAVHMHDGDTAKNKTFENIRAVRYSEISLICGANASMYNTLDYNNDATVSNAANPMDTSPAPIWVNISQDAMAKQFGVDSVWKNGPRVWVTDWATIPIGPVLDFNGLKAQWMAYPSYPPNIASMGITAGAYVPTHVKRKSVYGFNAGQPVFMLVDPSGTPWVMQAYANIVDPTLVYNDLFTLGNKLHMPAGWSYKVQTLPKNLTISAYANNGTAIITQDDLGSSYNYCVKGTCSYIP